MAQKFVATRTQAKFRIRQRPRRVLANNRRSCLLNAGNSMNPHNANNNGNSNNNNVSNSNGAVPGLLYA